MAKKLIKNYVFNPGLGLTDNARPNAYSLILQNRTFLIKEIVSYIQNLVDASDPDYVGYTYNTEKCERDSGYVIDALLFDLRYGGNQETRRVASLYWDEDVPQIDGSRIPEYESYQFLRDLINTYILTNTLDSTPEQTLAVQVVDGTKTTESGTTTRVTQLLNDLVSVIQNGLSSLPALTIGLGNIELLGKVGLEDILIITNVTDNTVIYNFAEPTKGGQVTFIQGNSESYPQALSVNNGVTTINFNFNTSSMSSSDEIQIFLEESELRVRLNDIATDAMERIKIGMPQAMLDADFEYGLQPTKWQAISLQRGYPSTYEISASDIPVINCVTDASVGTSGVGSSLITVTTQTAHQLTVGTPITIRALASSVTGFNRAEGTFLIVTVPSATTFTYYAKSKVGTSNGEVLATSNTQLRKADFYTGSNIGQPSFTVASNGSSGSFTTALRTPSGATTVTFVGTAPPIGAPLSGTGIASGTQVTGVFGPSNSDGLLDFRLLRSDANSGATVLSLDNISGVEAGMVVSDGSGTPTQIVITSVESNNIFLNSPIATSYRGDVRTYTGIVLSSSNYITGTGTGATFDVTVTSNVYSSVSINAGGSGYQVGDTLKILGSALGGVDVTNDLFLNVTTVSGGAVTAVSIVFGSENDGAGSGSFTGVASTQSANTNATNASVAIQRNAGSYVSGTISSAGTNFNEGNRFRVLGSLLGGVDTTNDCIVTVSVSGNEVISFTVTGTAVRGQEIAIYCAASISTSTNAQSNASTTISYSAIATIQIDFATDHGLVPGCSITTAITSTGSNHELAAGPFFVSEIVDANTIKYIARSPGTLDTAVPLEGTAYMRNDAFFSHRPFDGGVQLGTGGPQHGAHAIRQSKKYIRYQSGKGAMYNTGALFAPSFDIGSITSTGTSVGSIITVTTDDVDHGLQAGCTININGVETVGYDGDYTVSEIVDERSFKIISTTQLGSTTATIGSQCQMALKNWSGAVVRSGCFDDQNGIFWQYDGQQIAVVRRTSTFQVSGSIAINVDSNVVTGTNTRFLDQLQEGDRIVIRGMTHVVAKINNNTSMIVTPDFRGVTNIIGAKIAKIQDTVIPQSQWNLDKCDGTGPSGYEIDVTKMQMIAVQFTWYGAGFIDWMLRGPDGNYVFCHRLKGNNLNTEAYMRTGNLPVRYEVLNEGARGRLVGNLNDSDTTIPIDDVTLFPNSGTIFVDNEIISYTGKNSINNTLTGCTRGTTYSNFAAGSIRTYEAGSAASHNDRQGVVLISNTTSPIISHWGSAYLIDGKFDEDRGYLFNYAATGISASVDKVSAFFIRLAPSVSNAVTGDLGERELLNRAQLLLDKLSITSDTVTGGGAIVVEGILNPSNYPVNPSNISWNGLSGQAAGGQPSFAQIALGGSVDWGASLSTQTATITGVLSANFTTSISGGSFSNAIQNGRNRFFLTDAAADASGIQVGDRVNTTAYFPAGTTITSITRTFQGRPHTRYETSRNATATANAPLTPTITIEAQQTAASYVGTNFLFFTTASLTSSGAGRGTRVATSFTAFPAGTSISNVVARTLGATTIQRVTFSQSSNTTLNASGTVTFQFGADYALPGEQVFSFITNPGETSEIDLSDLKELTTTAIGGRGAFPNGPDVLAINVYKVSGSATNVNLILRWGEAQA